MNKNFTKSHKNQKSNLKKSKEKIITPSKKTLDFILSYANTTKSTVDNKFLFSLNMILSLLKKLSGALIFFALYSFKKNIPIFKLEID